MTYDSSALLVFRMRFLVSLYSRGVMSPDVEDSRPLRYVGLRIGDPQWQVAPPERVHRVQRKFMLTLFTCTSIIMCISLTYFDSWN
jgi:hypothetical protein